MKNTKKILSLLSITAIIAVYGSLTAFAADAPPSLGEGMGDLELAPPALGEGEGDAADDADAPPALGDGAGDPAPGGGAAPGGGGGNGGGGGGGGGNGGGGSPLPNNSGSSTSTGSTTGSTPTGTQTGTQTGTTKTTVKNPTVKLSETGPNSVAILYGTLVLSAGYAIYRKKYAHELEK